MDFHQKIGTDVNPKNEFIGRKHHNTPSPICPHKPPILGEEVLKIHTNINNNPITALNVRESLKFPWPIENLGQGTQMVTSDFRPEVKNIAILRMHSELYAI